MGADVDAVIAEFPPTPRLALATARALIEAEAKAVAPDRVLEASLKWGQPSFALAPKMGTPIRLGLNGGRPALFVHCATTLVEDWRQRMGPEADVSGTRAVHIDPGDVGALRPFIRAALTYRA